MHRLNINDTFTINNIKCWVKEHTYFWYVYEMIVEWMKATGKSVEFETEPELTNNKWEHQLL